MSHKAEVQLLEAGAKEAAAIQTFLETLAAETDTIVMERSLHKEDIPALAAHLEANQWRMDQFCFVAMLEDQVIGLVNIQTPTDDSRKHIGDVFIGVAEAFRGQGLGKALLEEAIDWAKEMGVLLKLSLSVQVENTPALALYQSLGFDIEGREIWGVRTPSGELRDLYHMAKRIGTEE